MIERINASTSRLVLGSILIWVLGYFHLALISQGHYAGWLSLIVLGLAFWRAKSKGSQEAVKHFQYKTASILSFLLPVSALLYGFVFTGVAVSTAGSEAEQVGSAIGGMIGSGILIFFAFIIGISLGITFLVLGKKSAS
jgi:hypothetical protein